MMISSGGFAITSAMLRDTIDTVLTGVPTRVTRVPPMGRSIGTEGGAVRAANGHNRASRPIEIANVRHVLIALESHPRAVPHPVRCCCDPTGPWTVCAEAAAVGT